MLVICPVDNKNACTWISTLEVDNVIGQVFVNVLARQCARKHLELITPYIHTYQNHFADLPTRPEKLLPADKVGGATYEQKMVAYVKYLDEHHPGYEVTDMGELAAHYIGNATLRGSTQLHDEPDECPAAAAAR